MQLQLHFTILRFNWLSYIGSTLVLDLLMEHLISFHPRFVCGCGLYQVQILILVVH
ncbi:unnamed protein product, partial [Arabidopsis halleri]